MAVLSIGLIGVVVPCIVDVAYDPDKPLEEFLERRNLEKNEVDNPTIVLMNPDPDLMMLRDQ